MLNIYIATGLQWSFVKEKNVLDIASGEGYGSALLAGVASKVTGVDISAEIVSQANAKYGSDRKNLEYLTGSTDSIPAPDHSFDVVVSFETIEHHDRHHQMMKEIKRVLKPGGLLIISSPDKYFYSEKPGTVNPFHVKELYKSEFESLLKEYFKESELYRQKAFFASVIIPDQALQVSSGNTKFYDGDYSEVNTDDEIESVYLLALASDGDIPKLTPSLFRDYQFIDNMRRRLESSTRYKFGNLILNPIQFFKQKFRRQKK